MNPDRAKELALALAAFPSVTDSEGEARFAPFLRELLTAWPYFRAHPEHIRLLKTLVDGRERYVLVALARPGSAFPESGPTGAFILTGHYDVVSACAAPSSSSPYPTRRAPPAAC
jgi:arginine utilization protein RocB